MKPTICIIEVQKRPDIQNTCYTDKRFDLQTFASLVLVVCLFAFVMKYKF